MQLEYVFKIISEKLPEAGIDYLLIGGFAVNHYGYTRNTLDVDFMILGSDVEIVRGVMRDLGFINMDEHDSVLFCSHADGGPRVDFLKVDVDTMNELQANSCEVKIYEYYVRLPSLRDLIAMKIFALTQNTARRMGKDLPDITYLTVLNDLKLDIDIKPLCERYGNPAVYKLIAEQVEELR